MSNNGNFQPVSFGGVNQTESESKGFCHFLKQFLCPSFKFLSFIFFISCIDILVYFMTISLGVEKNPNRLLAPTTDTLESFGMKMPRKIQEGQFWRLLTFSILHSDMVHILFNLFSQIIIGSYVEFRIKTIKTMILYFGSSIGGAIISCLISGNNGVGASISIYGLMAAYIAYFFLNWNYLDSEYGNSINKIYSLVFILIILLFNLSASLSNPMIDNWGHFGGFITGFFLLFTILPPELENDGICCGNKTWKIISYVITGGIFVLCLILLFTVKKY